MATSQGVGFVPMASIEKKPDKFEDQCTDWVATEKVHGSSFQFFTNDGTSIHIGSRRRALEMGGTFIQCSMSELMEKYQGHAAKLWHCIHSEDKWAPYRQPAPAHDENDDDDDESDGDNTCLVRIYGELYGGGGIKKNVKSAAQKEIIYSDEFRFYVFGITVNRRWVTIVELNELCAKAGFPYYAKPMCDPMPTIEGLKQFLKDNGVTRSKSSLSEKEGSANTFMEGVVMTPLNRPDFRFHAVKYLFPSFNDVRDLQRDNGRVRNGNYCTKQRYHSVISKLDIHEREDTEMVIAMFIADIIKESPDKNPTDKQRDIWRRVVTTWLTNDEYIHTKDNSNDNGNHEDTKKEEEEEEEEEGGMGMGIFD